MSYFLSATFAKLWAALKRVPINKSDEPWVADNLSMKIGSSIPCEENFFGALFAPATDVLVDHRPYNDDHF
jgi:hypothetical protein